MNTQTNGRSKQYDKSVTVFTILSCAGFFRFSVFFFFNTYTYFWLNKGSICELTKHTSSQTRNVIFMQPTSRVKKWSFIFICALIIIVINVIRAFLICFVFLLFSLNNSQNKKKPRNRNFFSSFSSSSSSICMFYVFFVSLSFWLFEWNLHKIYVQHEIFILYTEI